VYEDGSKQLDFWPVGISGRFLTKSLKWGVQKENEICAHRDFTIFNDS
jgi:hypothetical protein